MLWDLTPFFEDLEPLPEKITDENIMEFALLIHEAGLTKAWNTPYDFTPKGRAFMDELSKDVDKRLKEEGYDPELLKKKIADMQRKKKDDSAQT
jgi:hypothetical protein